MSFKTAGPGDHLIQRGQMPLHDDVLEAIDRLAAVVALHHGGELVEVTFAGFQSGHPTMQLTTYLGPVSVYFSPRR